jgi:hypothetical protein
MNPLAEPLEKVALKKMVAGIAGVIAEHLITPTPVPETVLGALPYAGLATAPTASAAITETSNSHLRM